MLANGQACSFVPCHAPPSIMQHFTWWTTTLQCLTLCRLIPRPITLTDVHPYSDASSGIGIAITIGSHWQGWRLIPGWTTVNGDRDIGWAEAVSFELLVRSVVNLGGHSHHYKLYGDNKGLSKVGGMDEVRTLQSTWYSSVSRTSLSCWMQWKSSTLSMSPVLRTPQMNPHAESTPLNPSFSHQYPCTQTSSHSALIANPHCHPLKFVSSKRALILHLQQGLLPASLRKRTCGGTLQTKVSVKTVKLWVSRFGNRLIQQHPVASIPHRYKKGLKLAASSLRPHCTVSKRLRQWIPHQQGHLASALTSVQDLEHILDVMSASWAPGTKETYSAGLLVYHVFCNARSIPEQL